METKFSRTLAQLRHGAGMSQRQLASDLKISQALLSHYENGSREPGLPFVCRVCDYFNVSADFLLGRSEEPAAGESSSLVRDELFRKTIEFSSAAVRESAESYIDAAARRVAAHIHNRTSPLEAAEAASDMAQAELRLLKNLPKK